MKKLLLSAVIFSALAVGSAQAANSDKDPKTKPSPVNEVEKPMSGTIVEPGEYLGAVRYKEQNGMFKLVIVCAGCEGVCFEINTYGNGQSELPGYGSATIMSYSTQQIGVGINTVTTVTIQAQ